MLEKKIREKILTRQEQEVPQQNSQNCKLK